MHNDQTPPPGYAGVQLCHSPVEGCEPLQAAGACHGIGTRPVADLHYP